MFAKQLTQPQNAQKLALKTELSLFHRSGHARRDTVTVADSSLHSNMLPQQPSGTLPPPLSFHSDFNHREQLTSFTPVILSTEGL